MSQKHFHDKNLTNTIIWQTVIYGTMCRYRFLTCPKAGFYAFGQIISALFCVNLSQSMSSQNSSSLINKHLFVWDRFLYKLLLSVVKKKPLFTKYIYTIQKCDTIFLHSEINYDYFGKNNNQNHVSLIDL